MTPSMFSNCSQARHYLGIPASTLYDRLIPLIDNPRRVKGKLRTVEMEASDTNRKIVLILKADLLAIAPVPMDAEDVYETEAA